MNTFNLTLDLSKRGLIQTVQIRQGDQNGTTIRATIADHGVAASTSGLTARFSMRLPDGTHYYRKAAALSGNVATVTIDEAQAASAVGRTGTAYFQLLQGTTVVASTESFTVVVLPDALADADVAESYDSAIQDAIDALDDAVEQLPSTVEDVLADHPEWTTTVQDGSITKAKLATDLARDRERLLYRLANMLTNTLPEGDVATATDAAKTPMAGLALYGRSTQDGTPTPSAPVSIESVAGNLLPNNVTTRTIAGVTYTVNEDGTISVSGTATATANQDIGRGITMLPAGTYTFGAGTGSGYSLFMYKIVDGTASVLRNSSGSFTLDADTSVFMRIAINSGAAVSGVVSPYIYRGSTAYPYVPYGNAGLWARGRNLLSSGTTKTVSGITYTVNADGSVNASGTASARSDFQFVTSLPLAAGTYTLSGAPQGGAGKWNLRLDRMSDNSNVALTEGNPTTFTLTEETSVYADIRVYNGQTVNITFYPQLEMGSTATAYQPYEQTVTPIDLDGHELRSLPDGTRDELNVDERGHAVLVQRVGSVTLDGSESGWEQKATNTSGKYRYSFPCGLPDGTSLGDKVVSNWTLCDRFTNASDAGPNDGTYTCHTGVSARRTASGEVIFFHTGETLADWKTWLASNPATLDYKLATPIAHDLGYVAAVPLVGPDMTAQAVPTAPMQLTYERDLDATLARLESAIAELATN